MGVIQWEHDGHQVSPINISKKGGQLIKWESILKMGIIRWEQNVKNKKGSFPGGHSVTGGLKMGVNVAAHTRHIFLGSSPPPRHQWSHARSHDCACGSVNNVYKLGWLRYYDTPRSAYSESPWFRDVQSFSAVTSRQSRFQGTYKEHDKYSPWNWTLMKVDIFATRHFF